MYLIKLAAKISPESSPIPIAIFTYLTIPLDEFLINEASLII